uniref:Uncharacterized protein n=1 Tax=Marseillevirus sp. TaxID=2809551 RepID=A0AA96EP64_9VIRU|nr:hypothetical protein MarDSR_115 [Marseillevirus sp.]
MVFRSNNFLTEITKPKRKTFCCSKRRCVTHSVHQSSLLSLAALWLTECGTESTPLGFSLRFIL